MRWIPAAMRETVGAAACLKGVEHEKRGDGGRRHLRGEPEKRGRREARKASVVELWSLLWSHPPYPQPTRCASLLSCRPATSPGAPSSLPKVSGLPPPPRQPGRPGRLEASHGLPPSPPPHPPGPCSGPTGAASPPSASLRELPSLQRVTDPLVPHLVSRRPFPFPCPLPLPLGPPLRPPTPLPPPPLA
jgi:hypothetical protein